MRLNKASSSHDIRLPLLLVGLILTVLIALWQQTSAASEAQVASLLKLPAPQVSNTPIKAPSPTPAKLASSVDTSSPSSVTVVINKQYGLPINYIPDSLIIPNIPNRHGANAQQSYLRSDAAHALEQLFASAAKNSINLTLVSGYRSGAYQKGLFNNALKSTPLAAVEQAIARPGHSEHQSGLGVDVGRLDTVCEIQQCFGDTAEGRWVRGHAAEFGFIIRYPEGKEAITGYEYEPWHLRYVGSPALARQIQDSGLTLEQYFGL